MLPIRHHYRLLRAIVAIPLGLGSLSMLASACVAEIAPDEGTLVEDGEVEYVGQVKQAVCLATYDQAIMDARNLIAQNCGPISACGSGDTSTHHDLQLQNGNYCACYAYMWNNRASYPWNALQVIYHEPAACSWPHLHLKKMNTCNYFHFDLHETFTGTDCVDGETASQIDEFFCQAGSRKGTCNDSAAPCPTASLSQPNDRWRLKIWNNTTFSGNPVEIRYDKVGSDGFDFDWGLGGPSACAGVDNFSVVFTRSAYFGSSGTYTFTTTTDDGVQLYINDVSILQAWYDQPPTSHSAQSYVSAGWHVLKMQYYEHGGGARAALNWTLGGGSGNPYPNCPCNRPDNYCQHSPSTPGCPMTYPGGYCDPNGNQSYEDGDWNKGWYDYQQYCK